MENNGEKSLAKQNAGVIIIIVALLIAVFGLGGYIVYDKLIADDEQEEVTETEKEKEEEKEVALNDSAVETQLKTNIGILERLEMTEISSNVYYRQGDVYAKNIKAADIKEEDKLYSILRNAYLNDSVFSTTDNGSDTKIADSSKIDELYKNVFGESINNHNSSSRQCPSFEYEEATKRYIGRSGCGGTSGRWILTKIDRITQKGNNYYAYVKLAAVEGGEKIFTDYEMTKEYKETVDRNNITSSSDPMRDGETFFSAVNKEEFSEYKYTFAKTKDGDYKFVSVEKVK